MPISKLIVPALVVVGAVVALRPSKPKRKAQKRTGKVRIYKEIGGAFDAAKKLPGCVILTFMTPAMLGPWKTAATGLSKEYPSVTFIGTADPVGAKKLQQDDLAWSTTAATGNLLENHYVVNGVDPDAMANEMENAVLSCPGVS